MGTAENNGKTFLLYLLAHSTVNRRAYSRCPFVIGSSGLQDWLYWQG